MKKYFIVILLIILCGCSNKKNTTITENTLNNINSAKEISKTRTAELISKEIQLAYTSYLFDNYSSYDLNSSCDFMNSKYFSLDNVKEVTCINDKTTITMMNNDIYTALYKNGEFTIKGAKEDIKIRIFN